jgi:hypothetical protein
MRYTSAVATTGSKLEALLMGHNPGFGRTMLAESLGFLARIPDREFEAYGVDKEYIATMRAYRGPVPARRARRRRLTG